MPVPTDDPQRVTHDAIESAADSDDNPEARKTASELLTYEYPNRVYRKEVKRLQRLVESYHEGLFPGVDSESCEHSLPEHISGRNASLHVQQRGRSALSAHFVCPRCGTMLAATVSGSLSVEAVAGGEDTADEAGE